MMDRVSRKPLRLESLADEGCRFLVVFDTNTRMATFNAMPEDSGSGNI